MDCYYIQNFIALKNTPSICISKYLLYLVIYEHQTIVCIIYEFVYMPINFINCTERSREVQGKSYQIVAENIFRNYIFQLFKNDYRKSENYKFKCSYFFIISMYK